MAQNLQKVLSFVSLIVTSISIGVYFYIHKKYVGTDTGPGFHLLVATNLVTVFLTFISSNIRIGADHNQTAKIVSLIALVPVMLYALILVVLFMLLR